MRIKYAFESGKQRRGSMTILLLFTLVILLTMLALMADLGRIFVVKNQLQNASDSGAIAAAITLALMVGDDGAANDEDEDDDDDEGEDKELDGGQVDAIENNGIDFVLANQIGFGGDFSASDIEVRIGFWDSTTGFTETKVNSNAVHIICLKQDEPMTFARFIGTNKLSVAAEAIAIVRNGRTVLVPQ